MFKLTRLESKQLDEIESGTNNDYFREYFLAKVSFLNSINNNFLNSSPESLELLKQTFGEQTSSFEGKSGLCLQWDFKAEDGNIYSVTHTQEGIDFGVVVNNNSTENLFTSAYLGRALIVFSEYVYFKINREYTQPC